jgi:nitronate monooxygenase
MLRTAITALFNIDLPILGASMGGVAGAELVTAVSQAGGLCILGRGNLEPDEVRRQIRATKQDTKKPFGIGLLFPSRAAVPTRSEKTRSLPPFLEKFVGPDGLADVPLIPIATNSPRSG